MSELPHAAPRGNAMTLATIRQAFTLPGRHLLFCQDHSPAAPPTSVELSTSVLSRLPDVVLLEWAAHGGMNS
jgi:hypothetical protein